MCPTQTAAIKQHRRCRLQPYFLALIFKIKITWLVFTYRKKAEWAAKSRCSTEQVHLDAAGGAEPENSTGLRHTKWLSLLAQQTREILFSLMGIPSTETNCSSLPRHSFLPCFLPEFGYLLLKQIACPSRCDLALSKGSQWEGTMWWDVQLRISLWCCLCKSANQISFNKLEQNTWSRHPGPWVAMSSSRPCSKGQKTKHWWKWGTKTPFRGYLKSFSSRGVWCRGYLWGTTQQGSWRFPGCDGTFGAKSGLAVEAAADVPSLYRC